MASYRIEFPDGESEPRELGADALDSLLREFSDEAKYPDGVRVRVRELNPRTVAEILGGLMSETESKRESAVRAVRYVVDDTGNGRRLGTEANATVRATVADGNSFRYSSRVVCWAEPSGLLSVAVHSYLDVYVTDSEAIELAEDYLREIGKVSRPPDFVC